MRTPRRGPGRFILVLAALGALAFFVGAPDPRTTRDHAGLVLVTRVVDGDTIDVGQGHERVRVRLKCVDAPETVHPTKPIEPYGPEASAYTKKSLTGKWVHLESDPEDEHDRYHRLLAYVFFEDGRLFNLDLLREGYAKTTKYPCRFRRAAERAEGEARAARRGVWSVPTPSAAASAQLGGPIIGNSRSRVYHLPGQATYSVAERSRVYFATEDEARREGYRRAAR